VVLLPLLVVLVLAVLLPLLVVLVLAVLLAVLVLLLLVSRWVEQGQGFARLWRRHAAPRISQGYHSYTHKDERTLFLRLFRHRPPLLGLGLDRVRYLGRAWAWLCRLQWMCE